MKGIADTGFLVAFANRNDRYQEWASRLAENIDLADLCLLRMSELHPRHHVVTVDRQDFRVYRRNRREMIPLVCPPDTG